MRKSNTFYNDGEIFNGSCKKVFYFNNKNYEAVLLVITGGYIGRVRRMPRQPWRRSSCESVSLGLSNVEFCNGSRIECGTCCSVNQITPGNTIYFYSERISIRTGMCCK
jgi:hypothetical protein